jgi:hypothetical protein
MTGAVVHDLEHPDEPAATDKKGDPTG